MQPLLPLLTLLALTLAATSTINPCTMTCIGADVRINTRGNRGSLILDDDIDLKQVLADLAARISILEDTVAAQNVGTVTTFAFTHNSLEIHCFAKCRRDGPEGHYY